MRKATITAPSTRTRSRTSANAQIYVANIAKGLSEVAPAHAADFKANADKLIAEMAALDKELKADFGGDPAGAAGASSPRTMPSSISARAYGIEFVSVQGVSTEAEPTRPRTWQDRPPGARRPSVRDLPGEHGRPAAGRDGGAGIRACRWAASSMPTPCPSPSGPAPDYLSLIRYNAKQLLAAMQ